MKGVYDMCVADRQFLREKINTSNNADNQQIVEFINDNLKYLI